VEFTAPQAAKESHMTTTSTNSGWQLTGTAAEAYERYMVPALMRPYTRELLGRARLQYGERVLDVACGTGVVARTAAERVACAGKVSALDVNATMLAVARQVAQFLDPPIEFVEGDVTKMPFPDAAFDVVACQFALMFFPDPAGALEEMRRVVASQGRLVLSVWRSAQHHVGWLRLIDALDRCIGTDAGDVFRSPFVFEKPDELRKLVDRAGWKDTRIEIVSAAIRYPSAAELVRMEMESMPLAELRGRMLDARAAIAAELERTLADQVDDFGVVFPSEALFVVARAG
jgi:SAM-dependent methyltransferase